MVPHKWFVKKKDNLVLCHSEHILCHLDVSVFPLLGNLLITNIAQVNNTIQIPVHMLKHIIDHHNVLQAQPK
jgi:hypothetical protein